MNRRTFVAALTPFVAGCFGGQPVSPTDDATPAPTATPTEAPPDTPEPAETATPEPEASEAVAEDIDTARDRLKEAMYVYTGGITDDLLSVSAESESFRAREVLLKLDEVQRALAEARAASTTPDQQETVRSLDEMQRFLTLATDAQSWLIDGHDALLDATADLNEERLADSEAAIERVETAAEEATAPTTTIEEDLDPESTAAFDAIGRDEYDAKVSQLADEASILDTLQRNAKDLRKGASMIAEAREEIDDDRTDDAADTADRAYDVVSEVENRLDGLLDDFPSGGDSFEEVTEDLYDLSSTFTAEADNIRDDYS